MDELKRIEDAIGKFQESVDEINEEMNRYKTYTPIGGVWRLGPLDKVSGKIELDPPFTPRHSGRYPWPAREDGKSQTSLYKTLHSMPKPSPGFIFANKDWIKSHTDFCLNLVTQTREYTLRTDLTNVHRLYRFDDYNSMLSTAESREAFEEHVVYELAKEYDNITIRKVLNMDSNRFNRFVSMLDAAGGRFQYDYEGGINSEPMATVQIPASMLDHLHIDGDGSIKEPSKKIPGIIDIRVFNDRAVQVTFADGSQTKCVCGKDETFDLYEGLAFCLFKRFLGKDTGHKHFNDLMRYAMKKLDEQEKNKKREAEIKAETKRHEEKMKRQAQRRKAKKREEKISMMVEALKRNREAVVKEVPVYSIPNPEKEGRE